MAALPLHDIHKLFFTLLSILDYCHLKGVCHNNITPESILYTTNNQFLLTDFGVSNMITYTWGSSQAAHSFEFSAPEVTRGERISTLMRSTIDIWSYGAVILNAITGAFIIESTSTVEYEQSFREGGTAWSMQLVLHKQFIEWPESEILWNKIPEALQMAVKHSLSYNPADRPKTSQMLANDNLLALLGMSGGCLDKKIGIEHTGRDVYIDLYVSYICMFIYIYI